MSSKKDEGLLQPDDFSRPSVSRDLDYPTDAFIFSKSGPLTIHFNRPIFLASVYLKAHRDEKFFLTSTHSIFNVQAYFGQRLELNATLVATNLEWRQYLPPQG